MNNQQLKTTDKELFDILNMKDATYKELTEDILKHLPKTYKEFTLLCFEKGGDKFIVYHNYKYGIMSRGPGMYSSTDSWGGLAREVKRNFYITNRKAK